ncbi:MAG TPA: preprotein translocase subunit YajC [Gaiellaceae bacterium]
MIVLLGVFWALMVMPRRRKQQQHMAMQDALAVGDEIISAGGMHGRVRTMGDKTLEVEIAKGVVVTLDRRAVAAVAREVEVEVEPAPEAEADAESEPEQEPR